MPGRRRAPHLRIGTWNLDARWDDRHRAFVDRLDCDVLLLTEVRPGVEISGMVGHHTKHRMARGQSWAAIFAADLTPLHDPHPAVALAEVEGIRVACSVLPWRGAGAHYPWGGDRSVDRVGDVVDAIVAAEPSIWGGDWNTSFASDGYSPAAGSRSRLRAAAERLQTQIPTLDLLSQHDAGRTIDHVAVPAQWRFRLAERHPAEHAGAMLSDHDAYVVEVTPLPVTDQKSPHPPMARHSR